MTGGGDPSPRPVRIQIDGGAAFDVGLQEDSLLRAALRAGLPFPYECSVGGCGCCRFDLLEGEMETLWAEAPGLSARDRQRGRRLACQSRPVGDCRIKLRLEAPDEAPVPPRRLTVELMERRAISPDMAEFSFRLPEAGRFRAGQYAVVTLPGVAGVRAYSMSHAPQDDGIWRFVIRRVPGGRGSAALFDQVSPGDQLTIDGPYGHGYLRETAREVVCIAGGSGLGPMLSIARGVLAEPGTRRLQVFLGLRHQDELGAAAELETLAGPRVQTTTVLSSPRADTPWSGATGFVHGAVEAALPQPLTDYDFYFAGPPPMVDAVQEMLVIRHRVPHAQIHFDRFV